MTANPGNASPAPEMHPNDTSTGNPVTPATGGSSRLVRVWLILLTIAASFTCLLTVGSALFVGAISLSFLGDQSEPGMFAGTNIVLWSLTGLMVVLLNVGVVGGWRAFRKNRIRRAVVLSLLALLPIGLCLAGIVIVLLTSSSPFPIDINWNPGN